MREEEGNGGRAQKRRQWVVVSYDVVDDKRRTKVMKTLAGYGRWVQYSVFECEVRPADLIRLQERLRQIIHEEQDDVRFYILCDRCLERVTTLGKAQLYRHELHCVI